MSDQIENIPTVRRPDLNGWLPIHTVEDVLALVNLMQTHHRTYGQFILFHGLEWERYMDGDFSALQPIPKSNELTEWDVALRPELVSMLDTAIERLNGLIVYDKTLRQRLREISPILDVVFSPDVRDFSLVLREVHAQDTRTLRAIAVP